MVKRLFVIALICLPVSLFAAGKIYTWTDADGNVFYGDRPPQTVEAEEIAIQGKKPEPIVVTAELLAGQWFGQINGGGEAKFTFNSNGSISLIQTRADQSVYSYQGIWTIENTTVTVITEFSQSAARGGQLKRSVEPVQLTYTIIRFGDGQMDLISGDERFSLRKTN